MQTTATTSAVSSETQTVELEVVVPITCRSRHADYSYHIQSYRPGPTTAGEPTPWELCSPQCQESITVHYCEKSSYKQLLAATCCQIHTKERCLKLR